jgi:hypothetical protein
MRPWIAAALTLAAAVALGYVHPFRDPRAEPKRGEVVSAYPKQIFFLVPLTHGWHCSH